VDSPALPFALRFNPNYDGGRIFSCGLNGAIGGASDTGKNFVFVWDLELNFDKVEQIDLFRLNGAYPLNNGNVFYYG